MRVADLMTGPLVTIGHDATVADAWSIIRSRQVRHLPVLDSDRRLIGMVTDHDLRLVILERCLQEEPDRLAQTLGRLRVNEIMTWAVITVRPDADIRDAARITTVFMLLGSMPFVLYLQALQGRPRRLFCDSQVLTFLGLYAAAVAALVLWQWLGGGETFPQALRDASFSVASIMTTTGFTTVDYQTWGGFAVVTILFLTVVGACTGSTAGGIKIYRLEILYATAKAQFRRIIQPHGVFVPYYGGKPIPDPVASSVMGFFFLFALTFATLTLALGAAGLDFLTSLSGVATAMANVGPGLGAIIGPSGNFAGLPDSAKWFLSLGMLLGRLELYGVLVLLWPEFWRG